MFKSQMFLSILLTTTLITVSLATFPNTATTTPPFGNFKN
jgi:hypothetical protein